MIDRKELLADLQTLLRKEIEPDLRKRSELPEIAAALKAEFDKAKKAKRTAMNYTDWRADTITQIGVAWVLSCVFIRFLEDNRLVDPPRLSGPTAAGDSHSALQRARDEYQLHIDANPEHSFRQYILSVIDDLSKLSGGKEVFGKNNILHQHRDWLSNDAAKLLYNFWQRIEPTTGELVHDFTDDADEGDPFDTRFLGDLYQDLSEAARKKYALLQTPDFVEEFILDRTLEPALDEFGLEPKPPKGSGLTTNTFRMIDPACGSGHFLLGAFDRILNRWLRKEPGTKVDVLVERTLSSIHGVDVNPFAVAIARFRLLLAAFRACHVTRLNQPIDFHVNIACGDSLYHGVERQQTLGDWTDESHYFGSEDAESLRHILQEGSFHAVVANPPYITPKDRAANQAYRRLYPNSCHRQYALSVPFIERVNRLAIRNNFHPGFTGQITSNSFMKAEFGKKVVEAYFPTIELTHVVDTSGAYIPGHGTPTVILFSRNRTAVSSVLRALMGIRGEPSTPMNAARGLVWTAILNQLDCPGSQSEYVSVDDSKRSLFQKHPWSIGGGGAAELKLWLDEHGDSQLKESIETISAGICITREDEAYLLGNECLARQKVDPRFRVGSVQGEHVRDWQLSGINTALFPYDDQFTPIGFESGRKVHQILWPLRELLWRRKELGGDHREMGRTWWEWNRFLSHRYAVPESIAYGFVATHNHFVFDDEKRVFNRTAPTIKLPEGATKDDYLQLLGFLNCSVVCFWMKQVGFNKGDSTDQHGARTIGDPAFNTYNFNGGLLKELPLPKLRRIEAVFTIVELTGKLGQFNVNQYIIEREEIKDRTNSIRQQLIELQEDLDWECYLLYGLLEENLTYRSSELLAVGRQECEEADRGSLSDKSSFGIRLGERAFEIVLARRVARGEVQTKWFERHGSTPITELPEEWPDDYKALVNRRIEVIESNPNIALIEQPEYKRRWNTEPWDSQVERALREWMLLRLESYFDFDGRMNDEGQATAKFDIGVTSVAKLADVAFKDDQFKEVAEVYRGRADFDPVKLIDELVADEHVPALPILRYKPAGIDKRAEWENTWRLQRIEDQIHAEVERTCRGALSEECAAAVTPEQPLDPYKAKLNVNKVDFTKLAEVVPSFEPTALAAGVSERSEPSASVVGSLKKGFAESKLGTLVDLQRLVTHEILGDIPVPSKYTSSDFISTGGAKYWKLRGKLDVPKERWVSLPHCQGEDQTLAIAWAGYDHLQLLQAIAAYFAEVQQLGGSDDPRLVPLLAAMDQQIPWVKQWHNDTDNEYGYALGDYFEEFIATEARNLSLTLEDIRAWEPPAKTAKRAKSSKKVSNKGTKEKS